ncbi:8-oxo-dGTP pyrophosphatase MutT (NUDIX family) [Paenibacillus rhizosphaerae]|uniref:8-oxo-dGTP pyrophosphatase MutT (NUDIX family) n=1 Tax=Paenibacillus rhizosphaerae TaxID=297318 RepID=A0A839TSE3_9BACL|nr:NUDIX domain-containing protein [Paenibacillus rhizosphaerae]MBB3129461.1 8-oxo-dGTP pyrophosphatase MutT (NUDIX family) [Paenibacillus rhizosphaerae]
MNPEENIIVASVSVLRNGEVLMIQEKKASAYGLWNFPSGQRETGEDLAQTAVREVKEETGLDVRLKAATGVYPFRSASGQQVILFHFVGEAAGGVLRVQNDEIMDGRWVAIDTLLHQPDEQLREAKVIKQITRRLLRKEFYPLDVFHGMIR